MSLVCNAPWSGLFVWNDGTVSYCGRTKAHGNLRRQDFRSFWNSPSVVNARTQILAGDYFASGCPPTCCFLTIKHPEEYVKYFDRAPETRRSSAATTALSAPSCAPPRSYAENAALIQCDTDQRRSVVSSYPETMSLQLFNYCSLRCPMCCFGVIPANMKKPTINIIDPLVLDRVKEVYPFISRVDLVGGELFDIPFEDNPLVRVLADMAEVAASTIKVTITTNGQHFSRKWADHLLQYPFIDIVAFSIDSFDPDVYARTRVNGSLDRVRRSIENLHAAKAARGAKRPLIKFNTILGAHTHDGVPEFVRNARLLGADEIEFQKLVVMGRQEFFAENNLFQPRHIDKLIRLWRDLVANEFNSNRHEIVGMITAYLTHHGQLDRVAGSDVEVPFAAQLLQDRYAGPVYGSYEAAQTFIAKRPFLSRIGFVAGTYKRMNSNDILVAIESPDRKIVEGTVNSVTFKDNAWVSLDIPKTPLEIDREYVLKIRSPQATPENAIAIRYSLAGKGFSFGGESRVGEMAHMLF